MWYKGHVFESLRQPLEDGVIVLLRARHYLTLPARFMLVAATNPCPCGYYRDPERECVCTPSSIQKYRRKLSGPLMDRIDIFVEVPQIQYEELTKQNHRAQDRERMLRETVQKARVLQRERFGEVKTNSQMGIEEIKKYCQIDGQSDALLKKYVDSSKLSARGYHRVLKLARTIADLEVSDNISFNHVSEALSYRIKEEI
ncbi:ATP-binding protein [Patescibacteria group bacterium]|nr:ATP-binding protein [Patescibacteria group bacterium]